MDLARGKSGLTGQLDANVPQLTRVKGVRVQKDTPRTNLTAGFHVGYLLSRHVSAGGELRDPRWFSTPIAVEANEKLRDNLSLAAGPRIEVKLDQGRWLRPGISYGIELDGPLRDQPYGIVQVDLLLNY